ncbi:hypothetical protein MBLNU459_g0296t1 [Dothideomycetes sp. NU459]
MATGSQVQLTLGEWPSFYLPGLAQEQATKTSALLQENHEKHHIFFNQSGFHNHIAHHLLTLYALGASPSQLQKHYDHNEEYQRPSKPLAENVIEDMHDPKHFLKYLGNEKYYNDYLSFFQTQIANKGWGKVLEEFVFAGDERADAMLTRLFAGFLHPIIHLGFGVEFHQPAIMAEGLAQAAVHDGWMAPFLLEAEKAAAKRSSQAPKTMVELIELAHADQSLLHKAADVDGNRIRDGIMKTAFDTMIGIVSQYRIPSAAQLEEHVAAMTDATAYFTGAAQRPNKQVKMDFYYMHSLNNSVHFPALMATDISDANKIRLLEWKVRTDVTLYASRGCPDLLLDEIVNYRPKQPKDSWEQIIARVCELQDDGHAAKLVRALAHGAKICKKYEEKDDFRIKGGMWLQLGHMAIDSVEGPGPTWVRSCGYDSAWEEIADRPRAQL